MAREKVDYGGLGEFKSKRDVRCVDGSFLCVFKKSLGRVSRGSLKGFSSVSLNSLDRTSKQEPKNVNSQLVLRVLLKVLDSTFTHRLQVSCGQ